MNHDAGSVARRRGGRVGWRGLPLLALLSLLSVLLLGSVCVDAGVVGCVCAMRSGDEAVQLKLETDQDGEVTITIGTNVITFAVRALETLETGWLLVSGDVVEVDVFSDGVLTSRCAIPIDRIPQQTHGSFCCDERPPVVTVSATPRSNSGWVSERVTVRIEADDGEAGSGIETIYYRSPKLNGGACAAIGRDQLDLGEHGSVATFSFVLGPYDGNGAYHIECWAVDAAGNESEREAIAVGLDFTEPTITGAPAIRPNKNGWHKANVTVHFECSDAVSGIADCAPDQQVRTEGANQSVFGTAIDHAGNKATTTVDDISIDKSEPSVSLELGDPDAGCRILVSVTASDGLSGVDSVIATDTGLGEIPLTRSYSEWTGTIQPDASGTVSVEVVDKAGNSTSRSATYILNVAIPPDVEICCNPVEGVAPLAVGFWTESIGDITSWHWQFGDGYSSSELNPSHTYSQPGRYRVTLAVRGPGGTDEDEFEWIDVASGARIGVIFGVGGLGDRGLNDAAWLGMRRVAEEYCIDEENLDWLSPGTSEECLVAQQTFAASGEYDLIVLIGWRHAEALAVTAGQFPEQRFAIIDSYSYVTGKNVLNVVFRDNEMSALIGAAAAMAAAHHGYSATGVVLGIPMPSPYAFEAGYRFGMAWGLRKYADIQGTAADVRMLYQYIGTFTDGAVAYESAVDLLGQRAVGIYNVFGEQLGAGDYAAVASCHSSSNTGSGPPYYFGSEFCEGWRGDGLHTLVSGMKRVDEAFRLAVEARLGGGAYGRYVELGVAEGGVGLSNLDDLAGHLDLYVERGAMSKLDMDRIIENWSETRETIPDWIWDAIGVLEAGIADGSIVVPTANTISDIEAIRKEYPLE